MHVVELWLGGDIPVGIDVDRRLVGLALLGGHHYYTIGCQRTIDTGGGSVLQHRNRLDIVGIDLAQRQVSSHVVDYNQRVGTDITGERADTTQDGLALSVVRIDLHAQTGHLTL